MSAHCHHDSHGPGDLNANNPRYRRILWWALIINAAMFAIEIAAGVQSGSVSLLADAIDFLGDAANYGVSLMVLGMTLAWRARAALLMLRDKWWRDQLRVVVGPDAVDPLAEDDPGR